MVGEVSAYGPATRSTALAAKYSLFAPMVVACLGLIVQVAGVLDGDLIALLRLVRTVALLQYLACDTHDEVDLWDVSIERCRICFDGSICD